MTFIVGPHSEHNLHPSVRIHETARINCRKLTIGEGGVINHGCVLEGDEITIGREFWMDEGAVIGGGSCFDPGAFLHAGDFLHMGRNSQINTARGVTIGDECGVGIETKVFGHGAYLDELAGFPVAFAPVTMGSRVWLPNAIVLPGVTIGSDVVVAAGAVVTADIPSGSLAGGVPARVIKPMAYPKALPHHQKVAIVERIALEVRNIGPHVVQDGTALVVDGTWFDLETRTIVGRHTKAGAVVLNQCRRRGIRFRYGVVNGEYTPWPAS